MFTDKRMPSAIVKKMYRRVIPFTVRVKIGKLRHRKEMKISKTYFERQETDFRDHIDEFMFDETRKADILRIFSLLKKNGATTFPEMNITVHEKYFRTKRLRRELTRPYQFA